MQFFACQPPSAIHAHISRRHYAINTTTNKQSKSHTQRIRKKGICLRLCHFLFLCSSKKNPHKIDSRSLSIDIFITHINYALMIILFVCCFPVILLYYQYQFINNILHIFLFSFSHFYIPYRKQTNKQKTRDILVCVPAAPLHILLCSFLFFAFLVCFFPLFILLNLPNNNSTRSIRIKKRAKSTKKITACNHH